MEEAASHPMYKVVASAVTIDGRVVLGRWKSKVVTKCKPDIMTVTSPEHIPLVKEAIKKLSPKGQLYILTYYPPMNELKGKTERLLT